MKLRIAVGMASPTPRHRPRRIIRTAAEILAGVSREEGCEKSRAKLLLYQNAEVPVAIFPSTVGRHD
jgi:hypothetical protein